MKLFESNKTKKKLVGHKSMTKQTVSHASVHVKFFCLKFVTRTCGSRFIAENRAKSMMMSSIRDDIFI